MIPFFQEQYKEIITSELHLQYKEIIINISTIHKALKGMEKTSSLKSDESSEIVHLLKEAEAITYCSIEYLLLL